MQNKDIIELFQSLKHDEQLSFIKSPDGTLELRHVRFVGDRSATVSKIIKPSELALSHINVFELFMVRSGDMYKSMTDKDPGIMSVNDVGVQL